MALCFCTKLHIKRNGITRFKFNINPIGSDAQHFGHASAQGITAHAIGAAATKNTATAIGNIDRKWTDPNPL